MDLPASPPPPITRGAPLFDLAALRSSRDYLDYLGRRWRGPERSASVSRTNLRVLRDRSSLHLGESDELGTLLAVLPRGYQPMTDPDAMLTELIPEHACCASRSDVLLNASAEIQVAGEPQGSLYWPGWDARSEAWAATNVLGRGGRAGPSLWIGDGSAQRQLADVLCIDGLGRVSPGAAVRTSAWTHEGDGFIHDDDGVGAAMADYHLWWAWRLHGYAREVSRSPWDLYLAQRAARRGIGALRSNVRTVQHIDHHLASQLERDR